MVVRVLISGVVMVDEQWRSPSDSIYRGRRSEKEQS